MEHTTRLSPVTANTTPYLTAPLSHALHSRIPCSLFIFALWPGVVPTPCLSLVDLITSTNRFPLIAKLVHHPGEQYDRTMHTNHFHNTSIVFGDREVGSAAASSSRAGRSRSRRADGPRVRFDVAPAAPEATAPASVNPFQGPGRTLPLSSRGDMGPPRDGRSLSQTYLKAPAGFDPRLKVTPGGMTLSSGAEPSGAGRKQGPVTQASFHTGLALGRLEVRVTPDSQAKRVPPAKEYSSHQQFKMDMNQHRRKTKEPEQMSRMPKTSSQEYGWRSGENEAQEETRHTRKLCRETRFQQSMTLGARGLGGYGSTI